MNLTQVSLIGKALSDPNRLRIIQLLTYRNVEYNAADGRIPCDIAGTTRQ